MQQELKGRKVRIKHRKRRLRTTNELEWTCRKHELIDWVKRNIMPTFDIVSEVDKQEIRNAIDQVNKEVSTRFDFKGSDARVEQVDYQLTVFADDEFKLEQVLDILRIKLTKRNVDVRCLDTGQSEKVSGNKVKQVVTVKTGLDSELAKKVVRSIKDSKLKVQASIQGEVVRVSGAKKDVLQETMQVVKKLIDDFPLQFQNFRD